MALEPTHFHPHLHSCMAGYGFYVVGDRLHPRRPEPRWPRQVLHPVRRQRVQLSLRVPVFHRDGGNNRLRLPIHHREVSRGHHSLSLPVTAGLHRGCLSYRLHVHQDVAAEEARGDTYVQPGRSGFAAGREVMPHVPSRESQEQPYGVRANPVQTHQGRLSRLYSRGAQYIQSHRTSGHTLAQRIFAPIVPSKVLKCNYQGLDQLPTP